MIGWLQGTVKRYVPGGVILNVGGVGYVVAVTAGCVSDLALESGLSLLIYTHVTDGAISLFGFQEEEQMWLFERLISVQGVGPKMGMNILNVGSSADIMSAIASGDVAFLTQVSGVGRRTAERIVVDLKDKMGALPVSLQTTHGSKMADVVDALVTMGYGQQEAREIVRNMEGISDRQVEDLIREALKMFSG